MNIIIMKKRENMIRLNNIKIRENLSDAEVFKRAIAKNKIKIDEVK